MKIKLKKKMWKSMEKENWNQTLFALDISYVHPVSLRFFFSYLLFDHVLLHGYNLLFLLGQT